MSFIISDGDIKWLEKNYPDLKYFSVINTPSQIKGLLKFDAVYEDKGKNHRIKDEYKIEIVLTSKPPSTLPQVKETDGRIKKAKEKFSKELLADVHMYPDEAVCLCAYPEEKTKLPNGFKLPNFFEKLLIPYFYAQSNFEKTGEWIWGERSHGTLGLLESYLESRKGGHNIDQIKEYVYYLRQLNDSEPFFQALRQKEKVKGHMSCFCGSQLKFRNCHKDAYQGLWNLKEDIQRNKIDID